MLLGRLGLGQIGRREFPCRFRLGRRSRLVVTAPGVLRQSAHRAAAWLVSGAGGHQTGRSL
jgi:hypothetical protein